MAEVCRPVCDWNRHPRLKPIYQKRKSGAHLRVSVSKHDTPGRYSPRSIETSPNENGFSATEGYLGAIHTGEIFDLSAIGVIRKKIDSAIALQLDLILVRALVSFESSNGELFSGKPYGVVVCAANSFARCSKHFQSFLQPLRIFPFPFVWNGLEAFLRTPRVHGQHVQ
jgi:hypothetical protein